MSENLYKGAAEQYAALGVDVEAAFAALDRTPLSIHCWQGDDVLGFESTDGKLSGGIAATGNYPGRARSLEELRADLAFALSKVPGSNKVNLHANYLDNGGKKIERNEIEPAHFSSWADWAADVKVGLDFNSTYFSHELGENGTLTNPDESIRAYWIEHGIRSRKIGEYLGKRTGQLCVTNHWIPDGLKEVPVDGMAPRQRLIDSMNKVFAPKLDASANRDAVESKLFGIGAEAYTPGSHEFYMAYAMQHPEVLLTLDAGHYHPTEVISYKIPALLCFMDKLLLHVSRPVRWDSDHVVLFDDETRQIMREVVRCNALDRVYIATDYFDASINRTAAWCIGSRNAKKALLAALLEPTEMLRKMEAEGDRSGVLLMQQELLAFPFGPIWEHYCQTRGVVSDGRELLSQIRDYEKNVLSARK